MFYAYLFTRLDAIYKLLDFLSFIGIIFTIIFIIYKVAMIVDKDVVEVSLSKLMNKLMVCASLVMLLNLLIPTTKEVAFIYIAPQLIENGAVKETIKAIPELSKLGIEYLNSKLEKEKLK